MIVWVINPSDRTIRSEEVPSIPEGYIDDPLLLNELGDVVYVERGSKDTRAFLLGDIRMPLVGVAYIVGTNENGDDVPPKSAYDSLLNSIDFGDVRNGMFHGERHIRAILDL